MRLIIDTNVVISSTLGRRDRLLLATEAGVTLMIPAAQMEEAIGVLVRKIHMPPAKALSLLQAVTVGVDIVEMDALAPARDAALARLQGRGWPDWPVLAAAMLLDADIWSDDRGFFGVGVAVWRRETVDIAIRQAAAV